MKGYFYKQSVFRNKNIILLKTYLSMNEPSLFEKDSRIPEIKCFIRLTLVSLIFFIINYQNNRGRMHKKNFRYDSPPMYSPSNPRTSRYQQLDYTSEQKLSQKIQKLKHALKKSQSHNEQMHSKVNYYRDLHEYEAKQLRQELKKCKKKYSHLEIEFGKKLQELDQLRIKTQYEDRETYGTLNEKIIKIRSMEGRIIELQTKNVELANKINQKNQKIKSLQSILDKIRNQDLQQNNFKIEKLEKQLSSKVKESLEYSRQLSTIKDINKQLMRKIEKANMTLAEQAQRNKQTIEQNKESKKDVSSLNKQITQLKQGKLKDKSQYQQKIASLEKMVIEKQFQKQRLAEKFNEETIKCQKMNRQIQQLLISYRDLQSKYSQLLQSQVQTQKQFEREFNVIAKQMARRHIIAKSIKGSTTPSSHSGSKKGLPYFNIQSKTIYPYDQRDSHEGYHLKY